MGGWGGGEKLSAVFAGAKVSQVRVAHNSSADEIVFGALAPDYQTHPRATCCNSSRNKKRSTPSSQADLDLAACDHRPDQGGEQRTPFARTDSDVSNRDQCSTGLCISEG